MVNLTKSIEIFSLIRVNFYILNLLDNSFNRAKINNYVYIKLERSDMLRSDGHV
jgi:hypothetical protein